MNGFIVKSPPFSTLPSLAYRYLPLLMVILTFAAIGDRSALATQELSREKLPEHWKSDAELTDVFFLNAHLGWAVGAQGVILRTTDGGESWKQIGQATDFEHNQMPLDQKFRALRRGAQTRSTGITSATSTNNPVRCRFESVHFVDPKHGWVAGGYKVPYVDRTRAVILKTNDGGITWKAIEGLVIPQIHRIKFTDPHNGWAIGQTSNLFPTGIFFTSNGGESWSSQSMGQTQGWIDAEPTEKGLATIDADGRLGTFNDNQYEPSVILGGDPVSISRLRMTDPQSGWAVGDGGALLKTSNGGLSWSPPDSVNGTLPISRIAKQYDLKTVSITQQKVWFAGDPGTHLFSIDRSTGQANTVRTPLRSRINQVHFLDDQHGWAVGTLGAIIATRDGGQTWQIQRGENQRVAMLCIALDYTTQPFEILSKYAGEENRLCASLVLKGTSQQHQIAIQATERLGSLFSQRIIPQGSADGKIVIDPDTILEKMVRAIRTMRPNVVLYDSPQFMASAGAGDSIDLVTILQKASKMAADTTAFPLQIDEAGLKPWQIDRLAIRDPTGNITINPQRLLTRTGALIEDVTALSRAIVGESTVTNELAKYRVSHLTTLNHMNAGDLLSGLDSRSGIPTRSSNNTMRKNLTMIQEITAKHKRFEQFDSFEAKNRYDLSVWNQQILSFALKLDQQTAGIWLVQLAERYLDSGKTALAANAMNLLASRWPDHPLSPAASTWLAHYYASVEFGQIEYMNRLQNGPVSQPESSEESIKTKGSFALAPRAVEYDGVSRLVWLPTHRNTDAESNSPNAKLAASTKAIDDSQAKFFEQRLRLAGKTLSQLGQRDPDLLAGPQYRLLAAQISRRINGSLVNESQFKSLVKQADDAGLAVAAQRELRIDDPQLSANDDSDMTCHFTDSRPTLDGKLDEPFWQSAIQHASPLQPTARNAKKVANGNSPRHHQDIRVMAFDDDFLYVGFTCQKISGQYYNSRNQPRPRDADLSRRDRIELKLDIDRDYRSSFRFVVDHRGWVREGCGGSIGWNPNWYVSQSETETSWSVEFAIPLEELIPDQIATDSIWAVQMERHTDGERDLWRDTVEPSPPMPNGLRSGLGARPNQFALVRFVNESSEPTESVPGSPPHELLEPIR